MKSAIYALLTMLGLATAFAQTVGPADPVVPYILTPPTAPAPTPSAAEISIDRFFEPGEDALTDSTPAVRRALAYFQEHHVRKLLFPQGKYFFKKDLAAEETVYVSNNDSGLKRIAFLIDGFQDFEIDGQKSQFLFQGFISPFLIENSKGVTLRNLSIDFQRTFHSEGTIFAVGDDSIDVAIGSDFPYRINNGLLDFVGKSGDESTHYPASNLLEFDRDKRETAFMVRDYISSDKRIARELAPGKARVQVKGMQATVGNTLVFWPPHRLVPGIIVQDSSGVQMTDVTIHHAGGMGVIAQRSSDISLERVKVTPSKGRVISTTADATHFVNCSGKISLIDCVFENQTDDATNIHGIYARIERILSPTEIEVQLVHNQQVGFDFLKPGVHAELVDKNSLITEGTAEVKSIDRLNNEYTRVVFKSSLPKTLEPGDVVANSETAPEVLIKGCTIRNNRARGILLGSRGPTVVENNHFHTPGAAILLEGDGRHWFEQAGVRNLIIRDNVFDNCNYGKWGRAVIQIRPGIASEEQSASRYNRNIEITGNLFRVFDGIPLVKGYSVDHLVFRDNRVERSTAYPDKRPAADPIQLTDSSNLDIEP